MGTHIVCGKGPQGDTKAEGDNCEVCSMDPSTKKWTTDKAKWRAEISQASTDVSTDRMGGCEECTQLGSYTAGCHCGGKGKRQHDETEKDAQLNAFRTHFVLVEPPPDTVDEIDDMEAMKDQMRAEIDTLFIDVTHRLGKVLTQINALEHRLCAADPDQKTIL